MPISNEFDDLLNYFDVLVTLLLACLVECLVTNGFVQSSLHLIIRRKDEVDRRSKSEDETLTMQLFDTIFWYYDHSLRTTQMHPLINRVTIKKKERRANSKIKKRSMKLMKSMFKIPLCIFFIQRDSSSCKNPVGNYEKRSVERRDYYTKIAIFDGC